MFVLMCITNLHAHVCVCMCLCFRSPGWVVWQNFLGGGFQPNSGNTTALDSMCHRSLFNPNDKVCMPRQETISYISCTRFPIQIQ